jgi:hypothetical protein
VAGTSSSRMKVASTRTATVMPTPISLVVTRMRMRRPGHDDKEAALVITPAVFSNPLTTAARLSSDCSHSSRIRLSRKKGHETCEEYLWPCLPYLRI